MFLKAFQSYKLEWQWVTVLLHHCYTHETAKCSELKLMIVHSDKSVTKHQIFMVVEMTLVQFFLLMLKWSS